jgi:hydrogenase maturation protease
MVLSSSFGKMEKPIAIAGAGNWLVSYDKIGPLVLSLVNGRYGSHVELCDLGSTTLSLLDYLHNQELLIIIDAGLQGKSPGEISVIEPNLETITFGVTSVHQIGPLETLNFANKLFPEKMPKRILLITVETNGIDEKIEKLACQRVIDILDQEISIFPHPTTSLPEEAGRN